MARPNSRLHPSLSCIFHPNPFHHSYATFLSYYPKKSVTVYPCKPVYPEPELVPVRVVLIPHARIVDIP